MEGGMQLSKSKNIWASELPAEEFKELSFVQSSVSKFRSQVVYCEDFEVDKTGKLNNSEVLSQTSQTNKYSERNDVVFKSIFRAVKKYYLESFKQYWAQNSISINKRNKKDAHDMIWIFVQNTFTNCTISSEYPNIDLNLISRYIGRISLPDLVNKTVGGYIFNKDIKSFYEWVYNYSRIKADKLFGSEPIRIIFKHFIECGGLAKMIETDERLQKHKNIVINKINEILDWFSTKTKN